MTKTNDNVVFRTMHLVETDVKVSASIKKVSKQFQWSVGIGVDSESVEMISFRGDAKSVQECMIRIRSLVLSLEDSLQDILSDVKHFVLDEYTDEIGDLSHGIE